MIIGSESVYWFLVISGYFIADTMMKFASFENKVEMLYKHVIPTPKEQCNTPVQVGVSFQEDTSLRYYVLSFLTL